MKALSIRQPWAWAILYAGKDVENRSWKPWNPDRKFRGQFIIHAGIGMTQMEYSDFQATMHDVSAVTPFLRHQHIPPFDDLPRGGFVGIARVIDVVADSASPWFCGPIALRLADAKPLQRFIPFKGQLGFFDVPEDIAREALAT